jgi:hypothetical protein
MDICETDAKSWYESHGISDSPWNDFTDKQQGMLGLETLGDSWDEVVSMREVGIPENGVLLYFEATACGLDENEIEYYAEENNSREQITPYILQNTTSKHLKDIFDDPSVNVLSVSAEVSTGGKPVITVECEALGTDIFN